MIPTVISSDSEKSSEALNTLRIIWHYWKKIAHRIGVFQSKLILSLFYFTLFMPFGVVFALFKDGLRIKNKTSSSWIVKNKQSETLEAMRKQS